MMKCDSNNIYMLIGLAIAIVLTGIIAIKLINKTREGLTSDDTDKTTTRIQDIVSKLKKETEKLDDTILLDKHRSDYEDLFLALEDYSNLALIQMLAFFANNPSLETDSAKTMIEGINQVNTLKTTLNDVMEFMDRKQTTTSANSSSIKSFFGSN